MEKNAINKSEKIYGVIYARYSSHAQREESIEDQIRECKDYAARVGITILHVYSDKAISGKTDHRPQFQKMVCDSSKKLWQYVIVYKVDRFARDRYDSANYRAKLKRNDVKVVSAKEAIPDGPEGIILESVLEGYAEYYSANLAQNVKRGMEGNAMDCKTNGVKVYGYRTGPDGKYEINPETAPVVKYVFEHYTEGEAQIDIINYLNSMGIRTAQGNYFGRNSINQIIRNEKYTGVYKFDEIRIEGGMPAIIDKLLFKNAQEQLSKNKHHVQNKCTRHNYLLTTKIFCGECGSGMIGRSGTSKSGAKYTYYNCLSHDNKSGCLKRPVRTDVIENLVLHTTIDYVLTDSMIQTIADKTMDFQSREEDNSILNSLQQQQTFVEKSIKNMLAAIEAGIINDATKERMDQLISEKDDIDAAIVRERIKRPKLEKDQIIFWLEQFKNGSITDEKYCIKLIHTFINSIYVFADKVIITYNYSGNKNKITLENLKKVLQSSESDSIRACSRVNGLVGHQGLEPRTDRL